MWLKSDRGEIEVYLCPEDDGGSSPRSTSSMDEGKGESVSAGSTFDSKSALEAATRSPNKSARCYKRTTRSATATAASAVVFRPEETEAMKYAFISEDDDLGTIGSTKSYLMMSDGDAAESATATGASGIKREPGTGDHNQAASRIVPVANVQTTYLSSPGSSSPRITQSTQQQLVPHPLILSSGANSSPTGSLPFLSLEPPLSEEDYNFALEASEGITDLFDEDLLLTSS